MLLVPYSRYLFYYISRMSVTPHLAIRTNKSHPIIPTLPQTTFCKAESMDHTQGGHSALQELSSEHKTKCTA